MIFSVLDAQNKNRMCAFVLEHVDYRYSLLEYVVYDYYTKIQDVIGHDDVHTRIGRALECAGRSSLKFSIHAVLMYLGCNDIEIRQSQIRKTHGSFELPKRNGQ